MIRALALTGPTASGKTALSIACAKALGCEIICCDSMQIYRGMDIGTAKATKKQRAKAMHHMIDVCDPGEPFSAKDYKDMAMSIAEDVVRRGKIPFFVGGTGLYIDTVKRIGAHEVPEADIEYRNSLLREASDEEGRRTLWERLSKIDPDSANAIHYNNTRRVIRAIEIFEKTGKKKSELDLLAARPDPRIRLAHITIDFHSRELLYERINRRVDLMFEDGLDEEVKRLYDGGVFIKDSTARQAIGYKELLAVIEGRQDIDEARAMIKQASRNYAKRQLTWFRTSDATVIFADNEDGVLKSEEKLTEEFLALAGHLYTEL